MAACLMQMRTLRLSISSSSDVEHALVALRSSQLSLLDDYLTPCAALASMDRLNCSRRKISEKSTRSRRDV